MRGAEPWAPDVSDLPSLPLPPTPLCALSTPLSFSTPSQKPGTCSGILKPVSGVWLHRSPLSSVEGGFS